MLRIEIIANRALTDEIIALIPGGGGENPPPFTMLTSVQGRGSSGPCRGDEVWPETNILIILYMEEAELLSLRKALGELKAAYPVQGVALFQTAQAKEIPLVQP